MDMLVQDVVVTVAALAAALSLVWRLGGLVKPRRQARAGCSGCASCPPARREPVAILPRQPLGGRSRVPASRGCDAASTRPVPASPGVLSSRTS